MILIPAHPAFSLNQISIVLKKPFDLIIVHCATQRADNMKYNDKIKCTDAAGVLLNVYSVLCWLRIFTFVPAKTAPPKKFDRAD